MHETVQERAGGEQKPREERQHVSAVLGEQKESADDRESR
jgi:hypothetical protein